MSKDAKARIALILLILIATLFGAILIISSNNKDLFALFSEFIGLACILPVVLGLILYWIVSSVFTEIYLNQDDNS